jgi:hypothetical protein
VSGLIAGLDISSKALHCALIPLDPDDGSDAPPVTLRSFDLPVFKPSSTTPAYRRVERCRVIRKALLELLRVVVEPEPYYADLVRYRMHEHEVAHVCIEEPFGSVSRSTVLWEILGAILASIPPYIERDTIQTYEWRALTWADTPRTIIGSWKNRAIDRSLFETGVEMNEHEAEAYLIARASRARLEKAVSA